VLHVVVLAVRAAVHQAVLANLVPAELCVGLLRSSVLRRGPHLLWRDHGPRRRSDAGCPGAASSGRARTGPPGPDARSQ